MPERSSVFDMIGPVMIGPSSSHTAGVVRIARTARKILQGAPERAEITFYNSFARTYEGHGSDRAIIAGLLDYKTDDLRIRESLQHAEAAGLTYTFKSVGNANTLHPNTIKVRLWKGDREITVMGQSRGGGVIKIVEVNGFGCDFSTTLHTTIITAEDRVGSIAFIANVISHDDCNIATMSVSRKGRNDLACQFLEMDSKLNDLTVQYLQSISWIKEVIYIPDIDL